MGVWGIGVSTPSPLAPQGPTGPTSTDYRSGEARFAPETEAQAPGSGDRAPVRPQRATTSFRVRFRITFSTTPCVVGLSEAGTTALLFVASVRCCFSLTVFYGDKSSLCRFSYCIFDLNFPYSGLRKQQSSTTEHFSVHFRFHVS